MSDLFVFAALSAMFWVPAVIMLVARLRNRRAPEPAPVDPHWEHFPVFDDGNLIGYRVRWSERDADGNWLMVGHYFAADDDEGPSIEWREVAAESHAKRFNDMAKCPWEYAGWRTPCET